MRELIKRAVFEPAIFMRRRFDGGRATVLFYHRFPADYAAVFRRQCAYLARRCHVISMSDLAARLRERRPLPPHTVVLTIDDAHRDFYTCAFPILREFGFPAIVYVPTAFLDGAWLWFDRYQYIFQHSPLEHAECRGLPPLPDAPIDLSSPGARTAAFEQICVRGQWLDAPQRDRLGDSLAELLQVSVPEVPTEEFAPMTWDQLRGMARQGIEFGGHTVNHPILQTLSTEQALEAEILGGKLRLEEEMQTAVAHFAYPSGRTEEVPPGAKEVVARAGFQTATTTLPGRAGPDDDPLWLPRIGSDPRIDWLRFRRAVAAVRV